MSNYLPAAIWVRIFHKLPVMSLVGCTYVCRAWKSLIVDHGFIYDHLTHTIQASNHDSSLFYCIVDGTGEQYYATESGNIGETNFSILGSPSDEIDTVVGTCNGLVCLVNFSLRNGDDHIIWNPCIGDRVELPKPTETYWINPYEEGGRQVILYGFGFDSTNKDFKLVRLAGYKVRDDTSIIAEVYSLAIGSWRSITAKLPQFLLNTLVLEQDYNIRNMFTEGALHWVVKRSLKGRICSFILTFDVSAEAFGELMLPKCLEESPFRVSILTGGESLAVLHKNDLNFGNYLFSIWVMKNYGDVESWTQVFHSDSTQYGGILRISALKSNGDVVITSLEGKTVVLDPIAGLVKRSGRRKLFPNCVGYYVPSLFLINKRHDFLSLSWEQGDSSIGGAPLDNIFAQAVDLIEEVSSSLDEKRKGLLRKIFVRYPRLMTINLGRRRFLSFMFEWLADLLVLVSNNSMATLGDTSREEVEVILADLERNNCDVHFTSDMRTLLAEKYASYQASRGLDEEAKELDLKLKELRVEAERAQARLDTIYNLMEQQKAPIFPLP